MHQDKSVSAVWNKYDAIHYLGVVHFFLLKIKTKSAFFFCNFYLIHRIADKIKLANNSNSHIPLPESCKIKESVDCVTYLKQMKKERPKSDCNQSYSS
jgi:hypothetical protein